MDLPLSVDTFDVSRDGVLAYAGGDFNHLPELYVRAKNGSIRQLTHLHAAWDGINLASTTIFSDQELRRHADRVGANSAIDGGPGSEITAGVLVHGGPSSNFSAAYGWETGWATAFSRRTDMSADGQSARPQTVTARIS